ncbi:hypothetical protein FQR65_LT13705 [Abscondita terminalis]|nr:hypothetical protein FQR65_LT13705 [Abscondita terminalis]
MVKNGKIVENQRFQRQRDKPRLTRLSSQLPSKGWFFKFSLSLLLILSLILLWQKLSNPRCFPVKNIKISGDLTYVKQSHLQQIILPFIAKGFFRLDSQGLKEKILHLPWIANVNIKRFWPDTLVVSFLTKKPIAFMGKHGLLDEQGEIQRDEFTGNTRVLAKKILDISEARESYAKNLLIKLSKSVIKSALLDDLQKIMSNFCPGLCLTRIAYIHPELKTQVYLNLGDNWRVKPEDDLLKALRESFGEESISIQY